MDSVPQGGNFDGLAGWLQVFYFYKFKEKNQNIFTCKGVNIKR